MIVHHPQNSEGSFHDGNALRNDEPALPNVDVHQRSPVESTAASQHRRVSRSLDLAAEGYLPSAVGLNIARAHGITDDRPVVMAVNFAASHHIGPLPTPSADQYLQAFGVPAAARGEIPVTPTLQQGLLAYYRGQPSASGERPQVRFLEPDQEVIEVNPLVGEGRVLGHPYVDALYCLQQQPEALAKHRGAAAVATFPTEDFHAAIPAGLDSVQSFDPAPANDKAIFREAMLRRGVTVVPGAHIEERTQLANVVESFAHASRVWLKVPGSGGDLVLPIDAPLSEDRLHRGIEQLRDEVAKAFRNNHYAVTFEEYWPAERAAPVGTKLVIEQHVGDMGRVLMNGSLSVVVDKDGRYNVYQVFRQIVDAATGEFRGGAPVRIETENDPTVIELFARNRGQGVERLFQQVQGIAEHTVEDLGFCGIWGADFWLVEHPDGEVHPYWCELNGRPIMNHMAWTIAEKVAPGACVNVNIWCSHELHSVTDLERAVGADLLYGTPETGLVMPIAMRSIQVRDESGNYQVVQRSNAAKMLICARDMDHADEILATLRERGVAFDSRTYAF